MLSKEQCFHKWFGAAMPEMQKETTALVNNICVSTTAAYLAGWDECARQSRGSAKQQTDNSDYTSVLVDIINGFCASKGVAHSDSFISELSAHLNAALQKQHCA
jgi:hypothetical protein